MSMTNGITSNTLLTDTSISQSERTGSVTRQSGESKVASSATANVQDGTSLSGVASLLAAASTTSDVRADKVAALKSAIDAGTYNVPASAVADKLINHLLE